MRLRLNSWDMKPIDAIMKYRIKPPTLSYSKPSRRMIALLNMAIMDKTAMIKFNPQNEYDYFSRLLLLLSRVPLICLDFEADMVYHRKMNFSTETGTTRRYTKIVILTNHKEIVYTFAAIQPALFRGTMKPRNSGTAVETEDFMLRQSHPKPHYRPLSRLSHEDELQGE